MYNVTEDLSTLLNVDSKVINKVFTKIMYCICEGIKEDSMQNIDISEFDFGFGTLYIKHDTNDVKYKFVPSKELNSNVINTSNSQLNLMENKLEQTLVTKLHLIYDDLC